MDYIKKNRTYGLSETAYFLSEKQKLNNLYREKLRQSSKSI